MRFLPPDLAALGDVRLAALDHATERDLKREIDRVALSDLRFARALKIALMVEDEIERRGLRS